MFNMLVLTSLPNVLLNQRLFIPVIHHCCGPNLLLGCCCFISTFSVLSPTPETVNTFFFKPQFCLNVYLVQSTSSLGSLLSVPFSHYISFWFNFLLPEVHLSVVLSVKVRDKKLFHLLFKNIIILLLPPHPFKEIIPVFSGQCHCC